MVIIVLKGLFVIRYYYDNDPSDALYEFNIEIKLQRIYMITRKRQERDISDYFVNIVIIDGSGYIV